MTSRAAIVGGGIGGLCAAIGLTKRGHDVTVFERRPSFDEVGAGITLWPNALASAESLGVREEISRRAQPVSLGPFVTDLGRTLRPFDWSGFERRNGQLEVIMRPDLVDVLRSALPEEALRANEGVIRVTEHGEVTTKSGAETFDLVVGADGIGSAVRRTLWPEAKPPRYAGYTTWRWITEPFADPLRRVHTIWAPGHDFGAVPLPGGRTYCFATTVEPPGGTSLDLSEFASWPEPVPSTLSSILPGSLMRHDVYFLPSLKTYVKGKVALLGDAAHAMTPDLGQGGCQAMVDAVALAALAPDLRAYDGVRRRKTQAISALAQTLHHSARLKPRVLREFRDFGLQLTPGWPASQFAQLAVGRPRSITALHAAV